MADNKRDNGKVIIALIIVLTIICGLLLGAIVGIVIKKDKMEDITESPGNEEVEFTYDVPVDDFDVDIDYDNLVSDAYVEPIADTETCYHIPEINIDHPKIDVINEKIYNTITDEKDIAYEYLPGTTYIYFETLKYTWTVKNDVLSIVVLKSRNYEGPYVAFFAFNISLKTGKELTGDEMYSFLNLDKPKTVNIVQQHAIEYAAEMREALGPPLEGYEIRLEQLTSIEEISNNTLCFTSEGNYMLITYPLPDEHRISNSLLNLETFEDMKDRKSPLFGCTGPHIRTEPIEETNNEWKDILTKYYWDQTINDRCIIRFFEDGTYKAYYYPDDFSSDFFPELLDEIETEGYYTYEIKNNKLYLKQQFGNQVNSTQYEWLDINSARILDTWVKERCKNAENIFYDTSWHPDNDEFYETAYYLKNTGWVTDENYYKTDKSESEEADIYTGFLLNEGYNEFWAYKHCKTPDSLNVESLLYDFDSDGTKELFLSAYDKDMPSYRGQALYTIRNGKVETLLLENQEFATMGYTMLRLKYDNVKKIPVVEKFSVEKDSSAATFSKSTMDFYTAENGFSEPVVNYETTWLQHNEPHGYYTEDIEKVKAETDLHYIEDKYFKFYKIDGEYVEDTRFKEYDTRYTTPESSELTLTEGTYKKPIK